MVRKAIINFLVFLVAALFLAALLVEWAAGCGEPIYRADGTWKTAKCVFIDNEIKEGRWK